MMGCGVGGANAAYASCRSPSHSKVTFGFAIGVLPLDYALCRTKMHKIKSIYITTAFALVNLVFVSLGVWIFAGMSGWCDADSCLQSAPHRLRSTFILSMRSLSPPFFLALSTQLRDCCAEVPWQHEQRGLCIFASCSIFSFPCVSSPVVQVLLPQTWRRWSIMAGSTGLVSLWPQVLTAYPLIGAIVMTLLIHREPVRMMSASSSKGQAG